VSNEFDIIYLENRWGYKSGPGSEPEQAKVWIDIVNSFLKQEDVKTVIDVGCGDWRLGQNYNLKNKVYTGIDISSVILDETMSYATDNVKFIHGDFDSLEIEPVDLIIIKDVLQHLPNSKIVSIVDKIKTHARYALFCDMYIKVNDRELNSDIPMGRARPIDLSKEPFSFDFEKIERYNGKQISLYRNESFE
jgi:SAM-dependent methyltransferase